MEAAVMETEQQARAGTDPRRGLFAAIGVIFLLLIVGTAASLLVLSGDEVATTVTSVGDESVTVQYVGSECELFTRADVEESAESVTVRLRVWDSPGACNDVGVTRTHTVTLDAAVGEREIHTAH